MKKQKLGQARWLRNYDIIRSNPQIKTTEEAVERGRVRRRIEARREALELFKEVWDA